MNYPAIVSVALTGLFFPLLPLLHILARRRRGGGLVYAVMVYVAAWVAAGWRLRGGELFTVDYILAGVGTIGFLVLGYLEFFSMLCRGFSLQIISDVFKRGAVTKEEVIAHYGGQGIDWMFNKRLATMQTLGMVKYDDTTLTVLPRGVYFGRLGLMVKRLLKMGKGG